MHKRRKGATPFLSRLLEIPRGEQRVLFTKPWEILPKIQGVIGELDTQRNAIAQIGVAV